MSEKLKAPFPWFGGKSKAAAIVWRGLGRVDNYIEPFFGSGAVLLLRPDPPGVETINDKDCHVANFWRATQHDPDGVAEYADYPVSEADLHARHRWLVLSEDAAAFRERMKTDPDYYDVRFAGWWCWGLCCWIGSGWCGYLKSGQKKRPALGNSRGLFKAPSEQLPRLKVAGGQGVNSLVRQLPLIGDLPRGEHRAAGRQESADSVCDDRRQWITTWFRRLRDRLRSVRVCCGDWERVVASESVTVRLGVTGVLLDPPYGEDADRDPDLYAVDSGSVAGRVRQWCLSRGSDPMMRIALCGYAGEGHESLESAGWTVIRWKSSGGYGNRTEKGRANSRRERIWFSPHCHRDASLFDRELAQKEQP